MSRELYCIVHAFHKFRNSPPLIMNIFQTMYSICRKRKGKRILFDQNFVQFVLCLVTLLYSIPYVNMLKSIRKSQITNLKQAQCSLILIKFFFQIQVRLRQSFRFEKLKIALEVYFKYLY
jgi:hypothetical protein